ncbi:MAG: hypothetical protein LAO08_00290 [Acidobacteriia bacterium]|nr:hypothetical protein [Terriglobia bacterium]
MNIVITVDDALIAGKVQLLRDWHRVLGTRYLKDSVVNATDELYDDAEQGIIDTVYAAVRDHLNKEMADMMKGA